MENKKSVLDARFGKKGLQVLLQTCIALLESGKTELVIAHLREQIAELNEEVANQTEGGSR
jgi:hypothetical protein